MYFVDGLTQQEIADELKVGQRNISDIIEVIQKKMVKAGKSKLKRNVCKHEINVSDAGCYHDPADLDRLTATSSYRWKWEASNKRE